MKIVKMSRNAEGFRRMPPSSISPDYILSNNQLPVNALRLMKASQAYRKRKKSYFV
jgi:hypothetical protein